MSREEKFVDHYAFMGVKETASTEEIGKAYRKLARKLHPDKARNRGQAAQEAAAAKFHALKQSYDVLKDEKKREKFDSKIKARVMAKKRHEELDAERRKMKDELERREKEASEGRTPWSEKSAAAAGGGEATRRARLNRIREENRQAMDRFLHKKRHEAAARAEFAAARAAESAGPARASGTSKAATPEVEEAAGAVTAFSEGIRERSVLLVSWGEAGLESVAGGEEGSAADAHVAGYFRKYGSVRDVLVLPSRREALLRFGTPAPAARASLDVHPEFTVSLARELPPALSSGERKRKKRERKETKKARKRERKERKRRRGERGEGVDVGSGDDGPGSGAGEAGAAEGEGDVAGAAAPAAEGERAGTVPHPPVGGAGLSFAAYEQATLRAILGEQVDLSPAVSA